MQGIEVPYQTPEQHQRATLYVPPAATWVLIAGRSIYELCKVGHERKDGAPGSTPDNDEWLWDHGRGYSLERWSFWKNRFSELATIEELGEKTMDLAARAAAEMQNSERQL